MTAEPAQIPLTRGHLYTMANEGKRYQTYDDATGELIGADGLGIHTRNPLKGTLTIGIGHTGPDIKPGDIWTEFLVMTNFRLDYHIALEGAYELIHNGTWNRAGEARQAVLADMCFEMGTAGVRKFMLMLANIRSSNWEAAAAEIMKSNYAKQAPTRAGRNAGMIRTGNWI